MTPHDLLAAFDVLAEAPGGIQRLRALILELAVRGKLVPQDPNDEPASVLLERIAAEKARLVKEGKTKSTKPLPRWNDDEIPFEVPQAWVWRRFTDVAVIASNLVKPEDFADLPHVAPDSIEKATGRLLGYRTVREDDVRSGKHRFFPGQILYSKIRPNLSKAIKVDFEGLCSADMYPIDPLINRDYLHLYILSPTFLGIVTTGDNRLAMPKVNQEQLSLIPVSVPPLPEQRRIVTRVNESMALLDRLEAARNAREDARVTLRDAALAALRDAPDSAAVEVAWARVAEHLDELFTAPTDVAPLRQSILQLAVRGKLVPQDPHDEPASVLLQRIAVERERLTQQGVIRKRKPQPALTVKDVAFALPSSWSWCRVDDLVYALGDGPHYSPSYVEASEGVPFLSTRNITQAGFQLEDVKYVSHTDHEAFCKRIRPEPGDILYTKGGTTGIALVNTLDFEFSVWVHVAVLKIAKEYLYPAYLALALNSPHCYQQSQFYTHGTGNRDLGLTRMVKITLPIPPVAEQRRIVAKVDELMAMCDALEARLRAVQDAQAAFAAAAVHHLDT